MGCRLALKFDIGDIETLNCCSYALAVTKGSSEYSLKVAKRVYEMGLEKTKGDFRANIRFRNGLWIGKLPFILVADTWAWVLHVNGRSREAFKIIGKCYNLNLEHYYIPQHCNEIKKALNK